MNYLIFALVTVTFLILLGMLSFIFHRLLYLFQDQSRNQMKMMEMIQEERKNLLDRIQSQTFQHYQALVQTDSISNIPQVYQPEEDGDYDVLNANNILIDFNDELEKLTNDAD